MVRGTASQPINRVHLVLVILALALSLPAGSREAQAQIRGQCEKEARVTNNVIVDTPSGIAIGRICYRSGSKFSVGPSSVQLRGVHAPDLPPGCLGRAPNYPKRCKAAIEALNQLSALLVNGANCRADIQQFSRWLAECVFEGQRVLAEEMVVRGFACATKKGAQFVAAEKVARANRVGLWSESGPRNPKKFPSRQCISG